MGLRPHFTNARDLSIVHWGWGPILRIPVRHPSGTGAGATPHCHSREGGNPWRGIDLCRCRYSKVRSS